MTTMRTNRLGSPVLKVSSNAGGHQPVTKEEFAAFAEPMRLDPPQMALAVSGGPDSMALAWCVQRWAEEKTASVKCFIVDHQLRLESSAEAELVRRRLVALGFETEILQWKHPEVSTRVHVLARKARYELLIEACKRCGVRNLLLAHQSDDQAETILMRFAKGSGIDGLAGMAPMTSMKGVRLVRPFLVVSKNRLIATCESAGVAYVIDPSNAKEKYARGRLRHVQQALAEEGFTAERLLDLGDRAREASEALQSVTEALLRVAVQSDAAGSVRLNLEHLRSAPKAVGLRALNACLLNIHRADYAPERAILLPVWEDLCSDTPMKTRTLHGCVVGKTATQATFVREFAAISDERPMVPGQTVLWDNRWQVTLSPSCEEKRFVVRALGFQPHEVVNSLSPGLCKTVSQGRVRAALPALWLGKEPKIIPSFEKNPGLLAYATVSVCF